MTFLSKIALESSDVEKKVVSFISSSPADCALCLASSPIKVDHKHFLLKSNRLVDPNEAPKSIVIKCGQCNNASVSLMCQCTSSFYCTHECRQAHWLVHSAACSAYLPSIDGSGEQQENSLDHSSSVGSNTSSIEDIRGPLPDSASPALTPFSVECRNQSPLFSPQPCLGSGYVKSLRATPLSTSLPYSTPRQKLNWSDTVDGTVAASLSSIVTEATAASNAPLKTIPNTKEDILDGSSSNLSAVPTSTPTAKVTVDSASVSVNQDAQSISPNNAPVVSPPSSETAKSTAPLTPVVTAPVVGHPEAPKPLITGPNVPVEMAPVVLTPVASPPVAQVVPPTTAAITNAPSSTVQSPVIPPVSVAPAVISPPKIVAVEPPAKPVDAIDSGDTADLYEGIISHAITLKLDEPSHYAVVWPSELSGDTFFLNPVSPVPNQILIQCASVRSDIEFGDVKPLPNPKVGIFCLAQQSSDNEIYRAKIVEAKSDQFNVYFIDWGNFDLVGPERIYALPPKLQPTSIPAQAVPCRARDEVTKKALEEAYDKERDINLRPLKKDTNTYTVSTV